MHSQKELTSLRVLVTRPKPQGEILCEEIKARGGEAILFPTLTILPPENTEIFKEALHHLDQYDWVVFTSPQAVSQSLSVVPSLSSDLKIATVGLGTAKLFPDAKRIIYPKEDWRSEGLLDLPEFHDVSGKKIAIVKGEGGRTFLANELTARGAKVVPIIAYRRALPHHLGELHVQDVDVIICTSNEGMQNLKLLLPDAWSELQSKPIVVISQRMVSRAQELGFKQILLAKNASHEAIIETLTQVRKNYMDNHPVPEETPRKKRIPWYGIGIFFSTIAVIIMIFLFFLTNYYYLQFLPRDINQQNNLQEVQKFQSDIQQQVKLLNDKLVSQNQAIQSLHQTQAQTEFNRDEWRVRGAEFLAKMANDKLQFENNIPQAIALLQNADSYLSGLTDDRLRPIRKALAADIIALQAVPQTDVVGSYMRLVALSDQIKQMPLPNKLQPNESATPPSNEHLPWWRRGLRQTEEALKKVVVIRYHEQDALPFIGPDQQNFLILNLQAEIANAKWGLLHQQPEIFKASITQAKNWITQYGESDSTITKSLITNLTQLEQVNVKPESPKISASLQAFQEYFAALAPQPPLSQ